MHSPLYWDQLATPFYEFCIGLAIYHSQHFNKFSEFANTQRFNEAVFDYYVIKNSFQINNSFKNLLLGIVIFDGNMLDFFIILMILDELDYTLVISKNDGGRKDWLWVTLLSHCFVNFQFS